MSKAHAAAGTTAERRVAAPRPGPPFAGCKEIARWRPWPERARPVSACVRPAPRGDSAPMCPARFVLGVAMLAALLAPPARALERPRVAATHAANPIRVDGVLDEADWARAAPITALRRIEDREGEAPSESTEVRVLFDAAHVYFGFRCWNRGPGAIRGSLAPRDQILDLDFAGVLLDTYQDRHRAYAFAVNPYGVQLDGIFVGEDVSTEWDGVWKAEVTRDGSDAGPPSSPSRCARSASPSAARARGASWCGGRSPRRTRSAAGRWCAPTWPATTCCRPPTSPGWTACAAAGSSTCSPTPPRPGPRSAARTARGRTATRTTWAWTRGCRSPPRWC